MGQNIGLGAKMPQIDKNVPNISIWVKTLSIMNLNPLCYQPTSFGGAMYRI